MGSPRAVVYITDNIKVVQWDGMDETYDMIRKDSVGTMRPEKNQLLVRNREHGRYDKVRIGEYIILSPFMLLYHIVEQEYVDRLEKIGKLTRV